MRVVLITLTYPPEPANQLHELLTHLKSSHGINTSVITSVPSYPIGKVYRGYRNRFSIDEISEVKIFRGPIFPSQSKNLLHRGLFYFSNFLSTICILFYRKSSKKEVFIVYQPPVSSFLAFFIFSIFFKRKYIFWINDMWPETLINYGLTNRYVIKVINIIYNHIYKNASKIIVLSEGFKQLMIEKGVDESKLAIVYNWYSGENHLCFNKKKESEKFKLTYAGNLGKFQKLSTIINVVNEVINLGYGVELDIYGYGTEYDLLKGHVNQIGLDSNIILHGRIDSSEVPLRLANSDALFVQLIPNDLFSRTIPHKIYEYMAASKPILAGISGDAAKEIITANCGIVCEPDSIDSLRDGLIRLINMSITEREQLGSNGHAFVFNHRNGKQAALEFNNIIQSISGN